MCQQRDGVGDFLSMLTIDTKQLTNVPVFTKH